ncbi:hypothetical protein YC2023_059759 [Brassica napus]
MIQFYHDVIPNIQYHGYSNSKNYQNPIVYIEDTTRKANNGCRLPRKRRSSTLINNSRSRTSSTLQRAAKNLYNRSLQEMVKP